MPEALAKLAGTTPPGDQGGSDLTDPGDHPADDPKAPFAAKHPSPPDPRDPLVLDLAGLGIKLKQTEELRKRNRSTHLDCTRFFDEFKRYQETEPYIRFFKSIGIPTLLDDRNQRHYVAFEFNHALLRGMGFGGLSRGDRLVIVFTTANASSSQVTSFKVSLLNDNYI